MTLENYLLKLRSDFHIERVTDDIVFIVDLDNGGMSVTNDAENVVKYLYNRFGNKRIVYRDSMGRWDELVHTNGHFTGYLPYSS